jgi:regulation of enolase protein 1 (concanavalin A-like superfamily)
MAHLHGDREGAPVACGIYACSPKGAGFAAEFRHVSIDTGRMR